MAQHNPLSLLKNPSQASVDQHQRSRSRSGSFLRAISLHSPHPSIQAQSTSSTPTAKFSSNDECCENSLSCNPDDFEIKNPIGKKKNGELMPFDLFLENNCIFNKRNA
jgi:hypothetical protein